jgi:Domain of unknown function (DUF4398)
MNQTKSARRPWNVQRISARHSTRNILRSAIGITVLGALSACSSVSTATKERVTETETSVQQAQQTLGNSEHGAVELQQAKEKLGSAKSAVEKGQDEEALRAATQAHLYADLAVAKSQSADARKAANDVVAGVDVLRQETERTTPTQR